MGRIVPQYRARLMYELFRQIRKSKAISPNYIRAVDRLALLDRLYTVELTKPLEQPHRETKEPEEVDQTEVLEAAESKRLLDEFNRKHYNGGANAGTTTAADQHTNP